jgi:hypothetical protein
MDPTILVTTLLRYGLDQLLDRHQEAHKYDVHDLVEPGAFGSEIRAHFKARASLHASVVVVALERGTGWRTSVLVKYGEPLRLRVQRGMYQVTAWFFAAARAPAGKLILAAIANAQIVVASNRAEKFVLTGEELRPSEVTAIRDTVPQELPFLLPGDEPRMLETGRGQLEIAAAPQLEILSTPACSYQDQTGQQCLAEPAKGERFCNRHADGRQADDEQEMEILGWVGTSALQAAHDS